MEISRYTYPSSSIVVGGTMMGLSASSFAFFLAASSFTATSRWRHLGIFAWHMAQCRDPAALMKVHDWHAMVAMPQEGAHPSGRASCGGALRAAAPSPDVLF